MADRQVCPHCGGTLDQLATVAADSKDSPLAEPAEHAKPTAQGQPDELTRALFGSYDAQAGVLQSDPDLAILHSAPMYPGFLDSISRAPASVQVDTLPRLPTGEEALGRTITKNDDPLVAKAIENVTESEEEGRARSSLPIILVASYASALTIALLWQAWKGGWNTKARPVGQAESAPAPGSDTDNRVDSYRVDPPSKLGEDRKVKIGQPIRLGEIEITPQSIEVGKVTLRHDRVDGSIEFKGAGVDAIWLNLTIKNKSEVLVFTPIDERLVRQPDRRLPDSFLQNGDGERIYTFPLPIRSEWAITHQLFPSLRPGECADVLVVSDVDALRRVHGPMAWRLKVHAEPDKTEEFEVTFDGSEVKPRAPEAEDSQSAPIRKDDGDSNCAADSQTTILTGDS
jgi:hypothetical protein